MNRESPYRWKTNHKFTPGSFVVCSCTQKENRVESPMHHQKQTSFKAAFYKAGFSCKIGTQVKSDHMMDLHKLLISSCSWEDYRVGWWWSLAFFLDCDTHKATTAPHYHIPQQFINIPTPPWHHLLPLLVFLHLPNNLFALSLCLRDCF